MLGTVQLVKLEVLALNRRMAKQIAYSWDPPLEVVESATVIGWVGRDGLESGAPKSILLQLPNGRYTFVAATARFVNQLVNVTDIPQIFIT